jgi:hypothetical protein
MSHRVFNFGKEIIHSKTKHILARNLSNPESGVRMLKTDPKDYPVLTPEEWYMLVSKVEGLSDLYGWKNVSEASQFVVRQKQAESKCLRGS